jgi:hypothetical protein
MAEARLITAIQLAWEVKVEVSAAADPQRTLANTFNIGNNTQILAFCRNTLQGWFDHRILYEDNYLH